MNLMFVPVGARASAAARASKGMRACGRACACSFRVCVLVEQGGSPISTSWTPSDLRGPPSLHPALARLPEKGTALWS